MKVVHAAKFYPPTLGGMETLVQSLCEATSADWDVSVVAANESRETVDGMLGRVRVVRAGSAGRVASVPLCPSLPLHLWRSRADCVVLHEPNPVAGSALWLRTPSRRLVIWHHSDLVRPWWAPATYGRLQRQLYRRADCIVVSNPVLAERSTLVQHARHVAVIPIGVDTDRFLSLDDAQLARAAAIRASCPAPRTLFVGRLVYYKGLDVLLESMQRCPGTLLLVGDGPLENGLRSQAQSLGLASRVRFVGRVSDEELPAYYHASDVFVLPSVAETEAYGVVQVEAMASGIPVVSTSLPTGVPWVNQDGVSGVIVPPRNSAALAAALTRLLEDPRQRRTLGERGRRRAHDLFRTDRMTAAFKELVEATVRAPETLNRRLAAAETT
jgi:rhamnosyl/mannosyltransferase